MRPSSPPCSRRLTSSPRCTDWPRTPPPAKSSPPSKATPSTPAPRGAGGLGRPAGAAAGRAGRPAARQALGAGPGGRELPIDGGKVNTGEDGWRDGKVAAFACRERGEPCDAAGLDERRLPPPS